MSASVDAMSTKLQDQGRDSIATVDRKQGSINIRGVSDMGPKMDKFKERLFYSEYSVLF